jgi:NADPH:quinone reductase-like Zn-dependent oxidoreductase
MGVAVRSTVPNTMRAVMLRGHGGHEMLDVRDDVPVPSPGDLEVLVRVGAAAVNNTDINTRVGWYATGTDGDGSWSGAALAFPRIQGIDACGTIVVVGPGVAGGRVGERVLVEPGWDDARTGRRVYLGSEVDGAFAEYVVVPTSVAHRIDSDLSDAELASFPCSWSTAENMVQRVGVTAGDRVLVTGASGGVGSAALQLARRRGAHVVAVASTGKHHQVAALADEVLDRSDDLVDKLGRKSVDAVIDVVGGEAWPSLLDLLRPRGRYAVAGAIAGPMVTLDLRMLYLHDLTLIGCTALDPHVFADLVGHIERGEVHPMIAATFPLEEMVAAQQQFETKNHLGKIVVQVASEHP